jgi:hypothetical protein
MYSFSQHGAVLGVHTVEKSRCMTMEQNGIDVTRPELLYSHITTAGISRTG